MNYPNDFNPDFQPGQIVGLDCQNTCLYAEVIQVVTQRQMCWVRPLMLVESASEGNADSGQSFQDIEQYRILSDLRQGSDLILPLSLFRVALDTEVIPLLMQLDEHPGKVTIPTLAHQHLQAFIRRVWQATPQVFQGLGNQKKEFRS